eukprot:jgi/Galph1/1324/GphlegSOOS_G6095.1
MDTSIEDEPECRICRGTAELNRPLFHPCKCSGSIKYIHEDCLVQWLTEIGSERCELCGSSFRFTAVYKQNSPSHLSLSELAIGIFSVFLETGRVLIRLVLACIVWLFLVPLVSSYTFRASLCLSSQELGNIFLAPNLRTLGFNVLLGYLICFLMLVLFLATASFRSFLHDLERERLEEERVRRSQRAAYNLRININTAAANNIAYEGPETLEDHRHQGDRGERGMFPGFLDADREEATIGMLLGISGSMRFMLDIASSVLVSNAFLFLLVLFTPLMIGSALLKFLPVILSPWKDYILRLFGESRILSMNSFIETKIGKIIVGYALFIVCLKNSNNRFRYIFFILVLGSISAWFELFGNIRSTKLRRIFSKYALFLKDALLFVKVASLLVIELGICPFFCGILIQRYCQPLLHSPGQGHSLHYFSDPFFSIILHWFLGVFFTFNTSLFIQTLRTFIRPELLFFFRNPEDPDFHPFRDLVELPLSVHSRQIILSIGLFGLIISSVVSFPTWLLQKVYPSLFPLNFEFRDTLTEGPICVLLFRFLLPLVSTHINVKSFLKHLLIKYIEMAGDILSIKELVLLPSDNSRPSRLVDNRSHSFSTFSLVLRGFLLLVGAWALLVVVMIAGFVPFFVGRQLTNLVGFYLPNDVYHFVMGFLSLLSFYRCCLFIFNAFLTSRTNGFMLVIVSRCRSLFSDVLKILTWYILFPTILGACIQNVFVNPSQLSLEETAHYNVFRCCYSGILIMKSYCKMHHIWRFLIDHRALVAGQAMEENGGSLLFSESDRKLLLPFLINICLLFSSCFLFLNLVLPLTRPSLRLFAWFDHHIYLFAFSCWFVNKLAKWAYGAFNSLYRRVFDSRYLVRRQLQNFHG